MKRLHAFTFISVFIAALFSITMVVFGNVMAAPLTVPYTDQRDAADAAVLWMISAHQNQDGGYASFSSGAGQFPSSVGGTVDAVLAIASTGYNPAVPIGDSQITPFDYFERHSAEMATYAGDGAGNAGKLVQALAAMGQNPHSFLGVDYVAILHMHLNGDGSFDSTPFNHSWALLGLAAVGDSVPMSATQWLVDQQQAAGSWSDGFGTLDNVDATAMAIMALAAHNTSPTATSMVSATSFLAASQVMTTAGWGYAGSSTSANANSTGLAVQALSALSEDFYSPSGTWAISGTTPLDALLAYQLEDGAFRFDEIFLPDANFFATAQALPAVAGRSYPLPSRYVAASEALACLATMQDPMTGAWPQFGDGGFGTNAAGTARAIQAIAAMDQSPNDEMWSVNSMTPLHVLESQTADYVTDGGRAGIVIQGVVAAGGDVSDVGGYNLPISVTQFITDSGEYADSSFGVLAHTEAILGLLAAGEPVDPLAVTFLQTQVLSTGLWSSFDDTGIALQALAGLGIEPPANTITALLTNQLPTGGWQSFGSLSVNSTAEVVQGIAAVGEHPYAPNHSQVVSGVLTNAADAVMAVQDDNGCWRPFGGDDAFATTDAIMMLMIDYRGPRYAAFLPLILEGME